MLATVKSEKTQIFSLPCLYCLLFVLRQAKLIATRVPSLSEPTKEAKTEIVTITICKILEVLGCGPLVQ